MGSSDSRSRAAGGTASGNLVQGNKIGTNFDGTTAIPNGLDGIFINDAPNNTIGGTAAGAGNLISGNGSVGIQLFGPLTSGNVIQGNALGLDSAGRPTLPNRAGGIFVNTGPLNNTIGGTAPGQANHGQTRPQFTVSGSQQSNRRIDGPGRNHGWTSIPDSWSSEDIPARSLYRSLTDDWRGERNVPAWPAAKGDVEHERQLPAEWRGDPVTEMNVSSGEHGPAGKPEVHPQVRSTTSGVLPWNRG